MVSNNKKITYVRAAIAAIGAKAGEATAVGVKVDANGNGVGKVGAPGCRRLGEDEAERLKAAVKEACEKWDKAYKADQKAYMAYYYKASPDPEEKKKAEKDWKEARDTNDNALDE